MHIVSLNTGTPETITYNNTTFISAIRKKNTHKAFLHELGFEGDSCVEEAHGGKDKAVHMFSFEDYSFFEEKAGTKIPIPAFGENITIANYNCDDACVGDIIAIGSAVLQVSEPTIRCSKIGSSLGLPLMLKWIHEKLKTGFYLRVLEPGTISEYSPVKVVKKGSLRGRISLLNHAMFCDIENKQLISSILSLEELSSGWKNKLTKQYSKTTGNIF